jgi:hypothetical protein
MPRSFRPLGYPREAFFSFAYGRIRNATKDCPRSYASYKSKAILLTLYCLNQGFLEYFLMSLMKSGLLCKLSKSGSFAA